MKITDVTISTVHGELNVSFISILHQHASQPLWKSQFMKKKVSHEHFTGKKIGPIMSHKDRALYHSNCGWWWWWGGGRVRVQRIVLGENGISRTRGVRMGEYGAMLSGILHWNINNIILFNNPQ